MHVPSTPHTLSSGARWWRQQIERRTEQRLRDLRTRGLWNGRPPVPVDHVAEHLLGLVISWEPVDEPDGEVVLGCLRPHTREIVFNETRMDRFEVPGVLRFTMGHEIGHADVFALADLATEQFTLGADVLNTRNAYHPRRRSSPKGDIAILVARLDTALRTVSRERRREVYEAVRDEEHARVSSGADTAIEAAACNHYASTLLMPNDLVRTEATTLDLRQRTAIRTLAQRFDVSFEAMRIRLEFMGLIHSIDDSGHVLLTDPAQEGQGTLFKA